MSEVLIAENCKDCKCYIMDGCSLSIEESKCTPKIRSALESIDADYRRQLSHRKDREDIVRLLEKNMAT